MTLKEAYQFLDLPNGADKNLLTARYREKSDLFKMLYTNAPNAIIRSLQRKNLETLEEIESLMSDIPEADPYSSNYKMQEEPQQNSNRVALKNESSSYFDIEKPLAYLIIHTENKDMQTFSLFEGENYIGRNEVKGNRSIVISDDTFVSRYHCTLSLSNSSRPTCIIADDGRYNNGKPSLNGTYYNGNSNRIRRQELNNGDTVQIGVTKLVFRLNTASKEQIEEEVEQSNFIKTIMVNI